MKRKPLLMEEITVKEVKEVIKAGKVVLLPLGVCEQHGFHLPLSTDSHNAFEICRGASALTGALVAPILNYAFSGGTLPDTINPTLVKCGSFQSNFRNADGVREEQRF